MTKSILISVLIGIIFAGFEGAADAAGSVVSEGQDYGHEMHGSVHADSHDHHGESDVESDHDEHFCHCGVHAAALFSLTVTPVADQGQVAPRRYDSRFASLTGPPLLRPPNS